jgi:hypothetical protein
MDLPLVTKDGPGNTVRRLLGDLCRNVDPDRPIAFFKGGRAMVGRRIFFLAGAMLVPVAAAPAQAPWTTIGNTAISDTANSATIAVTRRGNYSVLRICVGSHSALLNTAQLGFRSGPSRTLRINALIAPSTCTRSLSLRGSGTLTHVRVLYDPASVGHRRVVLSLSAR